MMKRGKQFKVQKDSAKFTKTVPSSQCRVHSTRIKRGEFDEK